MSVGNSDYQFKSSQPPPKGATESSSLEKDTFGGQLFSVKQKDRTTGTSSSSTIAAFKDEGVEFQPLEFKEPGKPGEPQLLPTKPYEPQAVQRNEWLNSTFMVALAVAFTTIAMLNKEIHKTEGAWMVRQLAYVWRASQDIAALIMAKAEKEAAMHMALAIGAIASLAVAVIGAVMTVGGKAMSASAKSKLAAMDEGAPQPANPQKTTTAGTERTVAPKTAQEPPPKLADTRTDLLRDVPPDHKIKPKTTDRPQQPTEELSPQQKLSQKDKLIKQERDGESIAGIGSAFSMSTQSVNSIIENFIQMYFKPQVAYIEQQIELARASKELANKALDSATQGVNSAGQDLDNAMQSWVKEQDENTRAHHLGPG